MAKDPLERVRQAVDAAAAAEAERYHAIADAVGQGLSRAEVGRAARVTGQRVTQILAKGPAPGPEASFFGSRDGLLTIAVGGKIEPAKETPGPLEPMTLNATITAYETVRDLAIQMGLDVNKREPIPPPGFVKLNRDGLVVICGPRLSPQIADVLTFDDALTFTKDERGWYMQDHREGKQRRSPLDNGGGGDLGYLGRLPRPDGRGNFLYMGGLHAPGTAGVAHYLAGNLPKLWTQVHASRFSALIRCALTPERQVKSSELIAGPYIHER